MSRTHTFVVVWIAICAGLAGVVVAGSVAHMLWAYQSEVYAQELQAQAALSQARGLEFQGLATSLKELPTVLLNLGAVIAGVGWLVLLVFIGFSLLRGSFAVSRVIEVRGGYTPLALTAAQITQEVPVMLKRIPKDESKKRLGVVDKPSLDRGVVDLVGRNAMVSSLSDEIGAHLRYEGKPSPASTAGNNGSGKARRVSPIKPTPHSTGRPVRGSNQA